MGIGAAFVTGLVQGFAKNIELERAKRIADEQKLDTLEATLAEYRMKPADERSASGINAVAAALRSARGEVKDRGRINLFGTSSPGLDIDIANMKGIMDEVGSYEFTLGTGDTKIGFNNKRPDNLNTSLAFIGELGAKLQDEKFRTALRKDKDVWSGVAEIMGAHHGYMNAQSVQNPGKDGEMLTYDPTAYPWWNDWDTINQSWLNSGKAGQGESVSAGESMRQFAVKENNNPNILGVTKTGKIIDYSKHTDTTNQIFTSDNMIAGFGDIKAAFQLRDDGDVYNTWHSNIAIAGVTNTVAERWFESSVKLGALQQNVFPRLDLLRPEEIMMLSKDGREATSIPNAYRVVSSVLPNDASGQPSIQAAAHALYPYFMQPEAPVQYVGGVYRYTKDNMTRTELALQLHYGKENPTGKTFGDLEKALQNEERVLTDIRSLAVKTAQLGDAAAYQEFKQVFRFGGSLIKSGFRDLSFLDELGLSDAQRNAIQMVEAGSEVPGITQEFLDGLGAEMAEARRLDADPKTARSDGVTYAEIASLRIGLAFKMARAADPSGRLSNQDVQQQLERLGSNFNTPEEVVRKLGVVVQEFEDRADRLRVLVNYGKGSTPMKPEERAIMEAAYSFDIMRRYGRKKNTVVQSNDPASFDILIENDIFVTKDGQPVFKAHRDAYTDPLRTDDGKDIFFVKGVDENGDETRTEVSRDNLKRKTAGDTSAAPAAAPAPANVDISQVPPQASSQLPTATMADAGKGPPATVTMPAASTAPAVVDDFLDSASGQALPASDLERGDYAKAGDPRTNVKPREVPLGAGVNVEDVMAALLQIQKANAAQQDDASVAGSAGEEGNIPMYDTEPNDVVIPPGGIDPDDVVVTGSRGNGLFTIKDKGATTNREGLYTVRNGFYFPAGEVM